MPRKPSGIRHRPKRIPVEGLAVSEIDIPACNVAGFQWLLAYVQPVTCKRCLAMKEEQTSEAS